MLSFRLSRCFALVFLPAAAFAACGGEPPAEVAPKRAPITQVAILGDSLASGYLVDEGSRYYELLLKNDDARYPSFAGRDLSSLAPDIELVSLAKEGDSGELTVRQAFTVPPNRTGRTLVIFSIGLAHLAFDPFRLLNPQGITLSVKERAGYVRAIAERFADPSRYPHGATLVAFEPIDSTDGLNRMPDALQDDLMCRLYEAFVATGSLNLFNEQSRQSVVVDQVETLQMMRHFAGHGWYHNDPSIPAYNPADPSLWLADCWHPNARGQHEIRRLIWEQVLAADTDL
ncbi:MAG: hypothetical protein JRH20_10740 [Deltaproteobacteria bacterium]|nr:hypothetical protein [Deltaproteobacteria bacterium]